MEEVDLAISRDEIIKHEIGSYEIDAYFLSQSGNRGQKIEKTLSDLIKNNPDYRFEASSTRGGGVRVKYTRRENNG